MNRLRELREKEGLSLKELGEKVHMSASVLGNYEREDRNPKKEVWEKLAKHFGVSTPYIMGLTDTEIDPSQQLSYLTKMISVNFRESGTKMKLMDNIPERKNSLLVMEAFSQVLSYIDCPDEEQANLATDTLIKAIVLVSNISSIKNKESKEQLKDLNEILIAINSTYRRSMAKETMYSKEKSIEKHLETLNKITDILNFWYMKNLDIKEFDQKEMTGFE